MNKPHTCGECRHYEEINKVYSMVADDGRVIRYRKGKCNYTFPGSELPKELRMTVFEIGLACPVFEEASTHE